MYRCHKYVIGLSKLKMRNENLVQLIEDLQNPLKPSWQIDK